MKNLYFALKDGKHGNREKYFLSTNKIPLTTKQMYSIPVNASWEYELKRENNECGDLILKT
jgi:hypothetical protein